MILADIIGMNSDDMKLRQEIAALKLTIKQKRFAEAYLEHFDTTQAVKDARYGGKNPSEMGIRLLANESIQTYIEILKREMSQRLNLKLEDVMREYMRIGFSNIEDFAEFTGRTITLKASKKMTREQKAAIASVESTREGVKVKMHSKMDALSKLKDFLTPAPGAAPPKGGTTINVNEMRIALGHASTRKALDVVSRAFLGTGMKDRSHLDKHVEEVTRALIAAKPDSGSD